jgi:hypothetical protein
MLMNVTSKVVMALRAAIDADINDEEFIIK